MHMHKSETIVPWRSRRHIKIKTPSYSQAAGCGGAAAPRKSTIPSQNTRTYLNVHWNTCLIACLLAGWGRSCLLACLGGLTGGAGKQGSRGSQGKKGARAKGKNNCFVGAVSTAFARSRSHARVLLVAFGACVCWHGVCVCARSTVPRAAWHIFL